MSHILKFEFPSKEAMDAFLGQFCDGGLEEDALNAMEISGFPNGQCDYAHAFLAWGASDADLESPTVTFQFSEGEE